MQYKIPERSSLLLVVRVALSLVLLISGVMKFDDLRSSAGSPQMLSGFNWHPDVESVAFVALAAFEVLVGCALWVRCLAGVASRVLLALGVVFAAVSGFELLTRGSATHCGCFGSMRVCDWPHVLIVNFIILGALALCECESSTRSVKRSPSRSGQP